VAIVDIPRYSIGSSAPSKDQIGNAEIDSRLRFRLHHGFELGRHLNRDVLRFRREGAVEICLPLAQPSAAVEYGWTASYPLRIWLRPCELPAPLFESRHDGNDDDAAHTDHLVRAARFGKDRGG